MVSPSEARAVFKHRKKMEERSFQHTLAASSMAGPSFSESAIEKAWLTAGSPLSGANAIPVTSTPDCGEKRKRLENLVGEDVNMSGGGDGAGGEGAAGVGDGNGEENQQQEPNSQDQSNQNL